MFDFFSFISDADLEEELIAGVKNRFVEQKFIYLGRGAQCYYDWCGGNKSYAYKGKEVYLPFIKGHLNKKQKIALVSLGCGNGLQEKDLLAGLHQEGYEFGYFGVDSSKEMLSLAYENLAPLSEVTKKFIRADFTRPRFRYEMNGLLKGYDTIIRGFLGGSFGNPNQTYIIDSLYSIMEPSDLLWFDVVGRKDNTLKTQTEFFKKYMGYCQHPAKNESDFMGLNTLGVPFDKGEIVLQTLEEDSLGARIFAFAFQLKKSHTISFKGHTVTLLPGEKIELLKIRNYDADKLQEFMEGHHFELLDRDSKPYSQYLHTAHFLFKKRAIS